MAEEALPGQILTCERRVWEALVAGDAEADAVTLAEEFLGVYPDGFAGKNSHTGQLDGGPTVARYVLSETRLMRLGPDHVLLAYLAAYLRTGQNVPEEMYVSSIWRRAGAGWINVFSQDTPATGDPVP